MFTPSNTHWPPLSGLSNPVSRVKKVVLPAPLGPMRAVIVPRWISTWSTSTATRPPKVRRTPSATRMGSGLAAPGTRSTPWWMATGSASLTDGHLLLVAQDALWSEDHEQHQGQAHDD